jgi:hypothetical protein
MPKLSEREPPAKLSSSLKKLKLPAFKESQMLDNLAHNTAFSY